MNRFETEATLKVLEQSGENIADVVRRARERRGLTQTQLSVLSGVPLRTLQGLEASKADPRFETIRALAKTLGLTTQELWGAGPASASLSGEALTGHLTAADVGVIVSALAKATPIQVSVILAILFRDESFVAPGQFGSLVEVLKAYRKAE